MGTQEPSTVVLRHHHPANTRNHKDRDVLGGPPEVANTGTTKRSTHRLFFAKSVLFVCVCSRLVCVSLSLHAVPAFASELVSVPPIPSSSF